MNNNVVVIGGNHHNTLSLVRCLGEKGLNVILLLETNRSNFVSCSKYIKKSYFCSNDNDILSSLNIIKKCHKEKTLIICASDHSASLLDLRFGQIKDSFFIANIKEKEGDLTAFMDKQTQTELAEKCGFIVPKSWLYNKEIEKDVEFPCLLKPLESIHGGKKIRVCYSIEDIHLALKDFSIEDKILVQEFIEKESEIVLIGLAICHEVYIPGYSYKHREINGGTTFSTVYPIEKFNQNIVDAVEKYVKEIGYEGLFGIECIEKKGKYYFIEINLRNDATCYSIAKAGVNLPYIYWAICNNQNYQKELTHKIEEITSMVEYSDILNIIYRKVSVWQWLKDWKTSKCKYIYDPKDLKPLFMCWWLFVSHLVKKII